MPDALLDPQEPASAYAPSGDHTFRVLGDVAPTLLSPGSPAKAVSPVPGGVGPLTVALLVDTVVDASEWRHADHASHPL